ncbi:hypothetical protein FNV43_RR22066 [Rhamnella rubrinervis]|uniref:Uncharacterized protein n=1 Tax=Rhamnella rubrinervis TaxID=2594499 RepID=A0A8K0GQQ7_9ROSA|nr:hypothetical protein FNV43_RR22066 [Rhamnella rubrinervis]
MVKVGGTVVGIGGAMIFRTCTVIDYNCRAVKGLKLVMLMVAIQISYAVMNILYKLAVVDGIDLRIPVTYCLICASAIMLLVALFFERGSLSALTTTTDVVALSNLILAITFVLAMCFRYFSKGPEMADGQTWS